MRPVVLLFLTPLLSNARACGSNEPAPAAATMNATLTAQAMLPLAKHGGTVVSVDDVQMELLVKDDGEVVAYPVQATTAAPPTLAADAQVTVAVPVQRGGTRPVNLVWSPVEMRFVGRVQGARVVTTRPADVEVTVVTRGHRHHHRVEHLVVAPATVVVVPPPPPRARVEATATVNVQAPTIDVRLGVPGVRVEVDDDYDHDEHHHHHDHHDHGRHRGWDMGMGHGMRH